MIRTARTRLAGRRWAGSSVAAAVNAARGRVPTTPGADSSSLPRCDRRARLGDPRRANHPDLLVSTGRLHLRRVQDGCRSGGSKSELGRWTVTIMFSEDGDGTRADAPSWRNRHGRSMESVAHAPQTYRPEPPHRRRKSRPPVRCPAFCMRFSNEPRTRSCCRTATRYTSSAHALP
jgi:hypothetical protein